MKGLRHILRVFIQPKFFFLFNIVYLLRAFFLFSNDVYDDFGSLYGVGSLHKNEYTFRYIDRLKNSNGSKGINVNNVSIAKTSVSFYSSFFNLSHIRTSNYNRKNMTRAIDFPQYFFVPEGLYPPTRTLIANPEPELQSLILSRKILYITYGHNCCAQTKQRACQSFYNVHAELRAVNKVSCIAAGIDDIDSEFRSQHSRIFGNSRGSGYFLWKPYLINRSLHDESLDEDDYIVYMDAGAYLQSPIHPLLVLLEHTPPSINGSTFVPCETLTFGVGLTQSDFCKRDAFVRQRCDTPSCHEAMQVNAAFSIWRKGPTSRRLAEAWLRDSTDFHTISDDPNVDGLPNLPGFRSHRHDQATLTNVLTRDHFPRDVTNGPATFMIIHDRNKS